MARINIALEATDQQGDIHEEGWTLLKVEAGEIREAKESGKYPYVNWRLSIQEPNPSGKPWAQVWHMTTQAPHALWGLQRFVHSCGISGKFEPGQFDTDDCLGAELYAYLTIEEYRGVKKNVFEKTKRAGVAPEGSSQPSPKDDDIPF